MTSKEIRRRLIGFTLGVALTFCGAKELVGQRRISEEALSRYSAAQAEALRLNAEIGAGDQFSEEELAGKRGDFDNQIELARQELMICRDKRRLGTAFLASFSSLFGLTYALREAFILGIKRRWEIPRFFQLAERQSHS